MRYLIIIMLLISSCIPTTFDDEDTVFIGDKESYDKKYKFHIGKLKNQTTYGWQLDVELESDSIFVKLNGWETNMYQIIDNVFFMTYGDSADTYTIMEILK